MPISDDAFGANVLKHTQTLQYSLQASRLVVNQIIYTHGWAISKLY